MQVFLKHPLYISFFFLVTHVIDSEWLFNIINAIQEAITMKILNLNACIDSNIWQKKALHRQSRDVLLLQICTCFSFLHEHIFKLLIFCRLACKLAQFVQDSNWATVFPVWKALLNGILSLMFIIFPETPWSRNFVGLQTYLKEIFRITKSFIKILQ